MENCNNGFENVLLDPCCVQDLQLLVFGLEHVEILSPEDVIKAGHHASLLKQTSPSPPGSPTAIFLTKGGHGDSRASEYLKEFFFKNLMNHPDFSRTSRTRSDMSIENFMVVKLKWKDQWHEAQSHR